MSMYDYDGDLNKSDNGKLGNDPPNKSANGVLNGVYLGLGVLVLMIIVGSILTFFLNKKQKKEADETGADSGISGPTAAKFDLEYHPSQQLPVAPPVPDSNPQPNNYGQAQAHIPDAEPQVILSDMPVVQAKPMPEIF